MSILLRRREFIAALGGATTWPFAAPAQKASMPVVGFLGLFPQSSTPVATFRQGLAAAGFVEGRTVAFEYRWANNQYERLPALAAELVQRQVAVIVAIDSGPAVLAAKAATSKIPIVFGLGADPVEFGLAASLRYPGGNMTGVSALSSELLSKQLDLLRQFSPTTTNFAYFVDFQARLAQQDTSRLVAAARDMGLQLLIVESEGEIETAFARFLQAGSGALIVGPYVIFDRNRQKILDFARGNKIPAIYPGRRYVAEGGLMSYGANPVGLRQVIVDYVARILKGAKPADLPIQQPTTFDFVINLKTARALGLAVPPTLFAVATEVIE
jgi:putative ABC transport system substrate-binding protein